MQVELEEALSITAGGNGQPLEILALNDALEELANADERRCKSIELATSVASAGRRDWANSFCVGGHVRRDLRAAEA